MNKKQATKKVSKEYKDSSQTKKLINELQPYIKRVNKDVDNNSLRLPSDLKKLRNEVSKINIGMAHYAFNQVRNNAIKKYPENKKMPKNVINNVDNMFTWQIIAIPKKTYDEHLSGKYLDVCLKSLPNYNRFLNIFNIKTNFKAPTKKLSYKEKRNKIASFLKIMKKNRSRILKLLNHNANE